MSVVLEDLRNVALVGHASAGKTTLADLILFKKSLNKRAGSVDDGSSLLDTDDDEHERKQSISASLFHFEHDGKVVTGIDAPGAPDFVGQSLGALAAVETALIVVNAHAGIEVNTRRMFRRAGELGVARMIVVNKCDTDNVDIPGLVDMLVESFGAGCVPLNLPVGTGEKFSGVVSTLSPPDSVPADVQGDVAATSTALMDQIAESDEELMLKYLEGEPLSPEEVAHGLHASIRSGGIIPILFCSAKNDAGVDEVLDAVATLALSPDEIDRTIRTADGEEQELTQDTSGPVVARVFKTRIDPFMGKTSFVRIYSGTINKGDSLHATGVSKPLKFGHLMRMQGAAHADLDEAYAGQIVAAVKLDDLTTNATISSEEGVTLPKIPFPTPMIGLAVEPESRADQTKISGALAKLVDEDPTFTITRDAQTHEMVMRGMSELHLKLVQDRLKNREKVNVVTHEPKVPYRETILGEGEGHYRHKKQSGGSGQFAEVHFRLFPMPQGVDPEEHFTKSRFSSMRSYHYDPELNFGFVDSITGGSIPNQFIPAAEKGVRERMEKGVLAGYQVQDVVVELFFGKDHPVDSNESAFKMAGSLCFREVFKQAKPTLLEPVVTLEITIPDDKMGDITSDLTSTRRGTVEGMDAVPGGFQVLHAKAPLSTVMTYQRFLASTTAGLGSFSMEFSHYEHVPGQEQQKIIAEAKQEEEEH